MTTTVPPYPASPFPMAYLTPECREGQRNPAWPGGCPTCKAPGYQHPDLGWMEVPCACPHHTQETP